LEFELCFSLFSCDPTHRCASRQPLRLVLLFQKEGGSLYGHHVRETRWSPFLTQESRQPKVWLIFSMLLFKSLIIGSISAGIVFLEISNHVRVDLFSLVVASSGLMPINQRTTVLVCVIPVAMAPSITHSNTCSKSNNKLNPSFNTYIEQGKSAPRFVISVKPKSPNKTTHV